MTTGTNGTDINDRLAELVNWEDGLISPEIFIDDEIYRKELEQVFGRAWIFIAHDSMLAKPGDFFNTYMGGDPVIAIRQKDNSVRVFLNACRHRGMKICRAEDGNAKNFMCTYHGWTYNTAGELINVPNLDTAYFNELDQKRWGLIEVAQIAQYKGLWFATFDATAPPLEDFLGDMTYYIDSWVDRTPGGIEILPGVIKWTIHGNWKMGAEQFGGDGYHAVITHASSLGTFDPAFLKDIKGIEFASRQGHGYSMVFDRMTRFADDPLGRYNEAQVPDRLERLGDARANTVGNFTVFPNLSGLPGSANLRMWHPKGPNEFEIWSWTVVDKDAPDSVKQAQRTSAAFTEGAAGVVETDDGENWDLIGQMLERGVQTRKMAWNYQMGHGHETDNDPVYPGRVLRNYFGEGPQRGFYRRWLEFMTSEEWPIAPATEPERTEHEAISMKAPAGGRAIAAMKGAINADNR
ncbi:aromatic ring-hydroxylating dioxygenase subunit alpha [Williamsia muralis]|uniref:Aromatic ring-hydroxylating dioxygenase subunit alpha n=1 Tax=Williamsia marianensis TaxID=85044 RepID=A0A2G3PGV8_WILMA|nr:aromatic ring-hydroxylating dioxygenase subunit alpha [Williamsia marianensis]PHV64926.1 aromatic ring-hydroxylating dioxygenase subunit alpha [Williamsia marianensis]PZT92977.1 MAG: aromatic ring-hydroxylating dioxygenase subunit alpha [Gordonia sp. (in: high G+C Gram-positive bacteria)]